MPILGSGALVLALLSALATVFFGFIGGKFLSRRYAELSRASLYFTVGCVLLASAALSYAFLTHDFSIRYVHGRSDLRMPVWYVAAAFWGGQEGSLLFWTSMTAIFGGGAAYFNRDRIPRVMPYFHAIIATILVAFIAILIFVTNPFRTFEVLNIPTDGEGLNPLLQTSLMVIHPPCLLSGFATFAVPYAFAMAALLARDYGTDWLRATRKWTLVSWLFLSVGNILGGMWAYRELGWGGYWAWDAVENAALIPWFTASAYLHSVIIQEQRGMFRKWNSILVALTFLLTLLGTWMTRSGLIQSVHTFAESDIGHFFLALLLTFTAFSIFVIALRWRELRTDHVMDSAMSREGAFLLNNWIFVGIAFVVLWGTLFPKLRELATGEPVSIGPAWFNQITAPLGLLLLLLMALGTLLPWRRTSLEALRRNFTLPVISTVLVTPAFALGYWKLRGEPLGVDPFTTLAGLALIGVALINFNVVTLGVEFWRGTRARMRAANTDAFSAFMDLFARQRRRYGGYVVHFGILMIFMAFLGNAGKVDVDDTLAVGETVSLGDYEVRFDSIEQRERVDRLEVYANMTLFRNGQRVGDLHPSRFDYNNQAMLGGQGGDMMKVTSEIYIRSTPVEDVYVALLRVSEDQQSAGFKLVVLPFTWWFWFGGMMLIAGTLVCIWPDDERNRAQYWRQRLASAAEAVAVLVVLCAPVAVFVQPMQAWAQTAGAQHDEHAHDAEPAHLTPAQRESANEIFALVMTTCSGCAGKSLSTASPGCVPSNHDKQRIRDLVLAGKSKQEILDIFVHERGQKALSVPPDNGWNRLSWLIPFAAIGTGVVVIGRFASTWSRKGAADLGPEAAPSPAATESAAGTGTKPGDPWESRIADELAGLD